MNKTNNFINNSNINQSSMSLPRIQIHMCNRRVVKDWTNASPVRPHWRFYWNPEPGAVVSDCYEKYYLDASYILIIPPDVRVKQVIEKPCESLFMHVAFDITKSDYANRIFTIPVSPALKETIERLSCAMLKFDSHYLFAAGEFAFALASRFPATIWRQRINDIRIESVCKLLREKPTREWSNRELAVRACFSENAFIRRFREVTGLPPQRYLQKLRLDKAAAMLLRDESSIDEIASACGFCDRHYLTRMFKKYFSQPPGRFRSGNNTP